MLLADTETRTTLGAPAIEIVLATQVPSHAHEPKQPAQATQPVAVDEEALDAVEPVVVPELVLALAEVTCAVEPDVVAPPTPEPCVSVHV